MLSDSMKVGHNHGAKDAPSRKCGICWLDATWSGLKFLFLHLRASMKVPDGPSHVVSFMQPGFSACISRLPDAVVSLPNLALEGLVSRPPPGVLLP